MSVRTRPVVYPDSGGKPMGEGTRQVQCIMALYIQFSALHLRRDDVFVAADLFWYPVKGDPKTVHAPDLMVAHGRPPGHRLSYKQWEEGGIAPQAVIEVMSPSDRPKVRARKLAFYDTHGVHEYFEYDEEKQVMRGWVRPPGGRLTPLPTAHGYDSPWLGVTLRGGAGRPVQLVPPGGAPFRSFPDLSRASAVVDRPAGANAWAAEAERQAARGAALAAKLRALGHDPDA